MSAQEELQQADESAIDNVQSEDQPSGNGFNVNVGKAAASLVGGKSKKKAAGIAATLAIVIIIGIALFTFLGGNFIPDAILTRFIEETDSQYADAVQSKDLVFQNALQYGQIPTNTYNRLNEAGVEVGYLDGDTFIASNVGPTIVADANDSAYLYGKESEKEPLSLKMGDQIITADEFYYEVNHNAKLRDAFTQATYGRAGYYYDESAQQVFEKIGTNRNNFTEDEDFEDTMNKIIGDENPIGFNDQTWHYMPTWHPSAAPVCAPILNTDGWEKVTDEFSCTGTNVSQIATWRVAKYGVECEPTGQVDENGLPICAPVCVFLGYEYFYTGDYGCNGKDTASYMKAMSQANMSKDNDIQTIKNTTDALKAADTMSKEQKSMRFYSGFMESISRMKAGYGSYNSETDKIIAAFGTVGASVGGSHINDVMNALFEPKESEVVDVVTGEKKTLSGSMVEAPSVYAVLAGEKVELEQVVDFSSDRILQTIGNSNEQLKVDNETILRTAANKEDSNNSTVGRFTPNPDKEITIDDKKYPVEFRDYTPDGSKILSEAGRHYNQGNYSDNDIGLVELTIKNSLYSTYGDIVGISAGELLAQGAVNVGRELANASGAAAGDEETTLSYLKLTADVLAMDAEIDRMHRSPLDITSKNTFLGSLVYKFAVSSIKSGSFLNKIASFSRITNKAVASLSPAAFAEEESKAYLSTFGDCETLDSIGAVGSPTCSAIATFDTTTYTTKVGNDEISIYQDEDFLEFIKENVECDDENNCEINDKETCKKLFGDCGDEKTMLAKYITFNENRNTPVGLSDASLVEDKREWENMNQSVLKRVWASIKSLFGLIDRIDYGLVPEEATGEEFVYSDKNLDENGNRRWDNYKYAQRYISLARAASAMRQYDGDETAYVFDGFGKGNPVARYIDKINQTSIASND